MYSVIIYQKNYDAVAITMLLVVKGTGLATQAFDVSDEMEKELIKVEE